MLPLDSNPKPCGYGNITYQVPLAYIRHFINIANPRVSVKAGDMINWVDSVEFSTTAFVII